MTDRTPARNEDEIRYEDCCADGQQQDDLCKNCLDNGYQREPGHRMTCPNCGQRYVGHSACGPSHAVMAAEIARAPYLSALIVREREDLAAERARADTAERDRDYARACFRQARENCNEARRERDEARAHAEAVETAIRAIEHADWCCTKGCVGHPIPVTRGTDGLIDMTNLVASIQGPPTYCDGKTCSCGNAPFLAALAGTGDTTDTPTNGARP